MSGKIDVLILDKDQEAAMGLYESIRSFLSLGEVDFTSAIPKGLSFCLERRYSLCLISGQLFDRAHLKSFIKDVRKISSEWEFKCAFVLVQNPERIRFDKEACETMGFDASILRAGTGASLNKDDRNTLVKLLEEVIHEQQVQTRILEIDSTMEMVLKDIDQVASEHKRGQKNKRLNKQILGYIKDQALYDSKVTEYYFQTLMKQTGAAAPQEIITLEIPQEILALDLPGLTATGYEGPSCRVWDKLVKKFGVTEEDD